MLIIELTYIKPIEEVNKLLEAHRKFLNKYYSSGVFLASGAKVPRDGGVIVALADPKNIDDVLRDDPFHQHGIAKYEITEFMPSKCCEQLRVLLGLDTN
jgi:uncharacterized protein YciI